MTQVLKPTLPTLGREQVRDWWRAQRAAGAELSPGVRIAVRSLAALAALGLWLVLFGLVLSGLVEAHAQSGLYQRYRLELAQGVAPIRGPVAAGSPVALVDAPAGGLRHVVVVEGTTASSLREGPGHLPGTPLPGQPGVTVLLGRSTTFGAPFDRVTALDPGDVITVTTGLGTSKYTVVDVRRPGDPLPTTLAANAGRLVLATTEGGGWRSGWAPSDVVYVDADLTGTAAPATEYTGAPSRSDGAMQRQTSGLYPMILWLQLLLVALVAGAWARHRWGRRPTWIVAAPVALVGLWGASTELFLLLPNLI
jgi:sortase A